MILIYCARTFFVQNRISCIDKDDMIYLDNAATSRFKPKCVLDALIFDVTHSANSGRAGHDEAIDKSIRIQKCREYLLSVFGASDEYSLIFTKNCTEALNLAIFGIVKGGERLLTGVNEHNSVLRPLYKLKQEGKISLEIVKTNPLGRIDVKDVEKFATNADILVFGGACNVNGAICDIQSIADYCKNNGKILILDGAQSVPLIPLTLKSSGISMLACPGHKGLHGVQGTGFLIVRKDIKLSPLLYGGTGTFSSDVTPIVEMPDSFEAGTLFSGGIDALRQGAKWSFDNVDKNRKYIDRITKNILHGLHDIGATLYTRDTQTGVVCFNLANADSGYIADKLNEYGICVRGGLHCAPLVHREQGTSFQGAVRASVGCETKEGEIAYFLSVVERLMKGLKS